MRVTVSIFIVVLTHEINTHKGGSYNFQSLFHILVDQKPALKDNLFNIHRLDRLTSGLTIIAKSSETAKVLGKCIMDRDGCHKVYVARVKGKFPLKAQEKDDIYYKGNTKPACVHGEWINRDDKPVSNEKVASPATIFWIEKSNGEIEENKSLKDVFDANVDVSSLDDCGIIKGSIWLNLAVPVEVRVEVFL